jgi:hypothetical protein
LLEVPTPPIARLVERRNALVVDGDDVVRSNKNADLRKQEAGLVWCDFSNSIKDDQNKVVVQLHLGSLVLARDVFHCQWVKREFLLDLLEIVFGWLGDIDPDQFVCSPDHVTDRFDREGVLQLVAAGMDFDADHDALLTAAGVDSRAAV